VSRMLAVGGSPEANQTAVQAARAYPHIIRAAVGYDRDQTDDGPDKEEDARRQTPDAGPEKTDVEEDDRRQPAHRSPLGEGGTTDQALLRRLPGYALARDRRRTSNGRKQMIDKLESLLRAPEVAAVGEIGLDFHCGQDSAAAQIKLFRRMLALARDCRLPVCVHTREAEDETLAALREHAAAWKGDAGRIGVMHCFTGGAEFARALLALGFFISFSGIITFKNAGALRGVAALAPDERLLIETDSPCLAPEPFRGRPNEPAHVRRVAEVLAEIRHSSSGAVAELSCRNAARLFGPWPAGPPFKG
jgi:TatD DNase family protein